jgi:ABC-type Zn uptake system ZnuABC Zn-binding protein ZnuA
MRSTLRLIAVLLIFLTACGQRPSASPADGLPRVLAIESFLADVTRQVAGGRLTVDSLIPLGADPHAFQPTPQDAARLADTDIVVINGANLEAFLAPLLENTAGKQMVISASKGLSPRSDPSGEHPEGDPHFWLDPNNVVQYVENIRAGLTQADPGGASVYAANAEKYTADLQALDAWIKLQVQQIPSDRRLLVTNHETFGYFAERYGFTLVGAIIPSISSGAASSAQELAALIDQVRSTGAPAIFLETGANVQLANQIAAETGVKVVTGLYTHSLGPDGGNADTYVKMMEYDVTAIVEALK